MSRQIGSTTQDAGSEQGLRLAQLWTRVLPASAVVPPNNVRAQSPTAPEADNLRWRVWQKKTRHIYLHTVTRATFLQSLSM